MRQLPLSNPVFALAKALPAPQEIAPDLLQQARQEQEAVNQWDVSSFFESQIDDRLNFGADENTVSIITSLLTGLSMLLLIEVTFRVVVRHREGRVSRYSLYRYHLIETWSNPLSWVTPIFRLCRSRRQVREHGNRPLSRNPTEIRYPVLKSLLIMFCGILLITAELSFIFLATNQNTRYHIDVSSIPTFEIRDEGLNFFLPDPTAGCSTAPMTAKPGFKSNANLQVCNDLFSATVNEEVVAPPPGSANVTVLWSSVSLQFVIRFGDANIFYDQYVQVTIQNGTGYRGTFNIRQRDCLNALTTKFQRNQLPILGNQTSGDESAQSGVKNEFTYTISNIVSVLVNTTSAPASCRTTSRMVTCLAGLVHGTFHPTGLGKGIVAVGNGNDWRLDEVEEPFVESQRPWLGVIPSIAVTGGLGLIFLMLNIVGWEGSIDGRWAWKEFFINTNTVGDFRRGDDETIELESRIGADGNEILGYQKHQYVESSDLEGTKD